MAYDNPAGLIAMSVILEVLAIGIVAMRFMSRRKTQAGFGVDDWLILAALMLGTGLCIVEIYGVVVEAFGYRWDVAASRPEMDRYYSSSELQFTFVLLNIAGITLVKLSVVFFYRRVFAASKLFSRISLVWIVILACWGAAFTFEQIFDCGLHVSANWGEYSNYEKYCRANNDDGHALDYSDLLTDFITLLMPLPMVARLQTSFRRKAAIAAVFAIGILTVATSAIRLATYINAITDTADPLVSITSLSVWHYLEVMLGIFAACAVTIRPVLVDLNLNVYTMRVISSIFTRRGSLSKDDDASDTTSHMNGKQANNLADRKHCHDLEAQGCDKSILRASEPGHITVEKTCNVSVVRSEDMASSIDGDLVAPRYWRSV